MHTQLNDKDMFINSSKKHEKIETHYQDMWVSINPFYYCPLTGTPMKLLKYFENLESLTYNLKAEKVNPKQQYFNTGATAYSSAVSYVITHDNNAKDVFLIRKRNDGFGEIAFKWSGTYSEWEAYSTMKAEKEFVKVMDRFNQM